MTATGVTTMDDQSQGTTALSQVVINGVEYAPDEAQRLVELGSKTREYEQKWNTSLDKVWPEYGKLSQERTQWQNEKQKYESQIAQFQQKQSQGVETPSDVVQARAAAKKLGIVLDEDLQSGNFVKRMILIGGMRRDAQKIQNARIKSRLSCQKRKN